jgi:transcription-repair coupling factor (superfamily II helicase)
MEHNGVVEKPRICNPIASHEQRSSNRMERRTMTNTLNDELVMHPVHGIGRILGPRTIEVEGTPIDTLELEYQDGALLIPISKLLKRGVLLYVSGRPRLDGLSKIGTHGACGSSASTSG